MLNRIVLTTVVFILLNLVNIVQGQDIIFTDDFESGAFDPTFWSAVPSVNGVEGGLVQVVSSIGGVNPAAYNGFNAVALGRQNDGSFTTNALDLLLDLSNYEQVELLFAIRHYNDVTHVEDGLFFSDDGGVTFKQVLGFDPTHWNAAYGILPPIDVDALAADAGLSLSATFVIRFQQGGRRDFNGFTANERAGILIDDVSVRSVVAEYATIPFADGFEEAEFGPNWKWGNPLYPWQTGPEGSVLTGGLVEIVSSIGDISNAAYEGFNAVALGRRRDGNFTANALDLYLDLGSAQQIELRFAIRDYEDVTHAEDGLFFSDDGGQRFKKAYAFDPSNWPPGYQELVVDIDSLVADIGLTLSSTFVVRFQQGGTRDFRGFTGNERSGILIDDLSVSNRMVTYNEAGSVNQDHFPLEQNYPNPFSQITTIPFSVEIPGNTQLSIFDLLGRKVAVLIDGFRASGNYEAVFDAFGLKDGVYFYKLESNEKIAMRRMTLLK